MPEKNKVFGEKIKHTGIFDFKDLYGFCFEWFDENDYIVEEEQYIEKKKTDEKDVEIQWRAWKKVTDYFKFEIKLYWRILGMRDVEIVENGKKKKVNNAFVEIKFTGTLIRDWEGKWEGNAFQKFLREVYNKFLIRDRIEQMEDKLFEDCTELVDQIKAYFSVAGRR